MVEDLDRQLRVRLGKQLRAFRVALGLTQVEAAARTSFTVDVWSRLERGVATNPAMALYVEAAKAVEVQVQQLFPLQQHPELTPALRRLVERLSGVDERTQETVLAAVAVLLDHTGS